MSENTEYALFADLVGNDSKKAREVAAWLLRYAEALETGEPCPATDRSKTMVDQNTEYAPFVLDNGEQLDITWEQATLLEDSGLIYNPEAGNRAYFTTPYSTTLDDVESFLASHKAAQND